MCAFQVVVAFVTFAVAGAQQPVSASPLHALKRVDLTAVYGEGKAVWRQVFPLPTSHTLRALWIEASRRIWAVGDGGTILTVDFDKLQAQTAPPWRLWDVGDDRDLMSVWNDGRGHTYVCGSTTGRVFRFDGSRWERFENVSGHLVGVSPEEVYAALSGAVWRFDGRAWTTQGGSPMENLCDVWRGPGGTLWAGSRPGIYRLSATRWEKVYDSKGRNGYEAIRALDGLSDEEAYACGRDGSLLRFDGKQWSRLAMLAKPIQDVVATRSGPIVASTVRVLRYRDQGWETLAEFPRTIMRMQIDSDGRIWVVGDAGLLGWADSRSATSLSWGAEHRVNDAAFAPSGEWYAVGTRGLVVRGNEATVERIEAGAQADLNGISVRAADDIYAWGDQSTVVHFDGTEWKHVGPAGTRVVRKLRQRDEPEPATVSIRDLLVRSPRDIYAVGHPCAVLHFDGESWREVGTTVKPREVFLGMGHFQVVPAFCSVWEAKGSIYASYTDRAHSGPAVGVEVIGGAPAQVAASPIPRGRIARAPTGVCFARIGDQLCRMEAGEWLPIARLDGEALSTLGSDGNIFALIAGKLKRLSDGVWVELNMPQSRGTGSIMPGRVTSSLLVMIRAGPQGRIIMVTGRSRFFPSAVFLYPGTHREGS